MQAADVATILCLQSSYIWSRVIYSDMKQRIVATLVWLNWIELK